MMSKFLDECWLYFEKHMKIVATLFPKFKFLGETLAYGDIKHILQTDGAGIGLRRQIDKISKTFNVIDKLNTEEAISLRKDYIKKFNDYISLCRPKNFQEEGRISCIISTIKQLESYGVIMGGDDDK